MAANLGMYIVTMLCHAVCCLVHKAADPEMEIMDWVCPWVELGRILLNFSWVGLLNIFRLFMTSFKYIYARRGLLSYLLPKFVYPQY